MNGSKFDDKVLVLRRNETGLVGLINQGATCYLNSLLQALFATPSFRRAILEWQYDPELHGEEKYCIPFQLQALFTRLLVSRRAAVDTKGLTTSFRWNRADSFKQNDIQELMRVMFGALEKFLDADKNSSFDLNAMFQGSAVDYTKCCRCHGIRARLDPFLDMCVNTQDFVADEKEEGGKKKVLFKSLQTCMEHYARPEAIDEARCALPGCDGSKGKVWKGLAIHRVPQVFTVLLKRFEFDFQRMQHLKLHHKVSFPRELKFDKQLLWPGVEGLPTRIHKAGGELPPEPQGNISQATPEGHAKKRPPPTAASTPDDYELYAVLMHSGSTSGGHYFAYIRSDVPQGLRGDDPEAEANENGDSDNDKDKNDANDKEVRAEDVDVAPDDAKPTGQQGGDGDENAPSEQQTAEPGWGTEDGWLEFNDAMVRDIETGWRTQAYGGHRQGASAYMLLYRRVQPGDKEPESLNYREAELTEKNANLQEYLRRASVWCGGDAQQGEHKVYRVPAGVSESLLETIRQEDEEYFIARAKYMKELRRRDCTVYHANSSYEFHFDCDETTVGGALRRCVQHFVPGEGESKDESDFSDLSDYRLRSYVAEMQWAGAAYTDLNLSIQKAGWRNEQVLFLEKRGEDGSFPEYNADVIPIRFTQAWGCLPSCDGGCSGGEGCDRCSDIILRSGHGAGVSYGDSFTLQLDKTGDFADFAGHVATYLQEHGYDDVTASSLRLVTLDGGDLSSGKSYCVWASGGSDQISRHLEGMPGTSLSGKGIRAGTQFYVELVRHDLSPDSKECAGSEPLHASRLVDAYLRAKCLIRVQFNTPEECDEKRSDQAHIPAHLRRIDYDNTIIARKTDTLAQLKVQIGDVLGLEEDEFRVARSQRAEQWKDTEKTLGSLDLIDMSGVYVSLGRPLGKNEVSVKFYLMMASVAGESKDDGESKTSTRKKNPLGLLFTLPIDRNTKVGQLKQDLLGYLSKKSPAFYHKNNQNKWGIQHLRLKDKGKKGISTRVLDDNHTLLQAFRRGMKDGMGIVLQRVEEPEHITNKHRLIRVRHWLAERGAFAPEFELVVRAMVTTGAFKQIISERSGIPTEHLRLAKGKLSSDTTVADMRSMRWHEADALPDNSLLKSVPLKMSGGCLLLYKDGREKEKLGTSAKKGPGRTSGRPKPWQRGGGRRQTGGGVSVYSGKRPEQSLKIEVVLPGQKKKSEETTSEKPAGNDAPANSKSQGDK